ncbi:MAG: hypothetical protein ABI797_01065 [Chloroflexota bacterium]
MTAIPRARPLAGLQEGAVRLAPRQGSRPLTAPRRRISRPDRAGRRAHPVGILLATILVTFLIGLIYLAQTVQLAATNYNVGQLNSLRDDLHRQVQTVETSVLRWGTESTVLERAQQLGLDQLPTRVHLIAR